MREWVHGLFGPDAVKGQTVRCQRTVLLVHSPVTTLGPLADRRGRKRALCLATFAESHALMLTGHDDIDEPRNDLHYPGRSPWA